MLDEQEWQGHGYKKIPGSTSVKGCAFCIYEYLIEAAHKVADNNTSQLMI